MPPFGAALGEEERWDLINFIRALAAGERARQMTPVVQPNRPWLVAPDFTIAVGPAPPPQGAARSMDGAPRVLHPAGLAPSARPARRGLQHAAGHRHRGHRGAAG